jgi:dihydrodipicolinate synthase/N-acetylneuraminate lyase
LDEDRQRKLTRYYLECDVGGLAVGVHTTQFQIRKKGIELYEPVLRIAADEIDGFESTQSIIKIAGIVGPVDQAAAEATLAKQIGYHLGLLSMGGLAGLTERELLNRAKRVAEIIPLFGFYLQPTVGGRILSFNFWKEFAEIPNVYAIKVAAFNRYQTLDVVRAVCHSSRCNEIALYTGNDDNIVVDLLTPYRFIIEGRPVTKKFVGGLLGHWAVWTKSAVRLLQQIKNSDESDLNAIHYLLAEGVKVTDMNAAVFDVQNSFHGCIPGIHEVLRRQGLLEGTWCLDPNETLSPGQVEEIERVMREYPEYTV